MMPTIRIDDDVFEALQKQARAFVDTPNDVLRRIFHLGEPSPAWAPRAVQIGSEKRTPKEAYRLPILEVLLEAGGAGRVEDVLDRVGTKMKGILKPVDYQNNRSGAVRWRNTAMWERLTMVREGLLKPNSPRGVWEITESGRKNHERVRDEGR